MSKLSKSYYLQDDVVFLAKDLLGKQLVYLSGEEKLAGIITETEAYAGVSDRASHAFGGKRTKRTETMFSEGGVAYVYLCYGIHSLLNVVTNSEGIPHAVLIRAVSPRLGLEKMLDNTGKSKNQIKSLCNGPGKLTKAFGIDRGLDSASLLGNTFYIENSEKVPDDEVVAGPRVGIDYAGEDKNLPYRFIWKKGLS